MTSNMIDAHLKRKRQGRCVVLPMSIKRDVYAGFIEVSTGECFRISLSCNEGGGQVIPSSLCVDASLQSRLIPFLPSLLGRLQQTSTVDSFLFELSDLAEQATSALRGDSDQKKSTVSAEFYDLLLNELEEIGWGRVVELDAVNKVVTIRGSDDGNRSHELVAYLPPDFPQSAPECSTDLPVELILIPQISTPTSLHFSSQASAYPLRSVVKQWEECLVQCQELFDQLDDLDDHTWVLEPERKPQQSPIASSVHTSSCSSSPSSSSSTVAPNKRKNGVDIGMGNNNSSVQSRPARRHLHRRIAIAPHVSILFEVSADKPFQVPNNVRFLGRDSLVSPLRLQFGAQVASQWDGSGKTSLRHNLERCLGITFPKPSNKSNQGSDDGDRVSDFQSECAICYTYRLTLTGNASTHPSSSSSEPGSGKKENNETASLIPEVVCSNSKCSRAYHSHCLNEWLCGLPNASRSFGSLFGHCPYCFVSISVGIKTN